MDKDSAEKLKEDIKKKEEAKNKDPVLDEDEEKAKVEADIDALSKTADRAKAKKD